MNSSFKAISGILVGMMWLFCRHATANSRNLQVDAAIALAGQTVQCEVTTGRSEPVIPVLRVALGKKILLQHSIRDDEHTISVQVPEIRPGVAIPLEFSLIAGSQALATCTVTALGELPFTSTNGALKSKQIGIYEPSPDRPVCQSLRQAGFPFEQVDDFDSFTGQWLLMTGLMMDTYGNWKQTFERLIDRGVSILIIPPVEGLLELPRTESMLMSTKLPDLDAGGWKLCQKAEETGLGYSLAGVGEQVALHFSDQGYYSWLQAETGTCRLVFMGQLIAADISTNPEAQWRLLQVLIPAFSNDLITKPDTE